MKRNRQFLLNRFVMLIASCLIWSTAISQDQPNTVTGKVLDPTTKEPIAGVVVAVKGTTTATTTDVDGNYSIEAPANGTLVFSYAGFAEVERPVNSATTLDLTMEEDVSQLQEVVAIGYGTQEKEDVTGAISSVKTRDLTQVVVTDPTQAIQGRVTGVTVAQNTGAPGSPITIRVRGVGTIGNSNPLYVVNNVPVSDIGYLNTNDIESIDILKDASSAAVYGSRAANGVVLITTRKGSPTNGNVEFRYLTGLSEPWKQRRMLTAKEWGTLVNEAYLRENGTVRYNPDTLGEGTNWQDEVFRRARMNSYYLSTSGGSEKYNYYVSGSYLQQEGIVKNSDFNRFNFQVNGDYNISKRIKVGTFLNTALSGQNQIYDIDPYNSVLAAALKMDPITQVFTGKGGDSAYASGQPGGGVLARTDYPNPVAILNTRFNNTKQLHLLGTAFVEFEILKGLRLKTQAGGFYSNLINSTFNARYYSDNTNQAQQSNVGRTLVNGTGIVWENSLFYDRTIGTKHKVSGLLLTGLQNNRGEYFFASKNNTFNNDEYLRYLDAATNATSASARGGASENSLVSYLARVGYEFDNRYAITANIRRDGSSRFPENNRWGNFPSVAAGWKVSNEGFFEGLRGVVSFFKLRASYGKLGNQNIAGGDYPYTTNIVSGGTNFLAQNYAFGGITQSGSSPIGLGNRLIKWETVTTANFAADLGFLNDRLLFSADYFTRRTTDMIIQRSVPLLTGLVNPPFVNFGEIYNQGLELLAELRNSEHALKYRIGGNITFIKNEVTKLGQPIEDGFVKIVTANRTAEGRSVAEFYGHQVDGIVQTPEEAAALQIAQPNVQAGDFKFKDVNGDGVITADDRVFLGSPLPKFTYGFNLSLEHSGFDLTVFFQGSQGNKLFNSAKTDIESGITNSNFTAAMLNRWHGPGTSNTIPRVLTADRNDNRRASSYYVEDGSYLRLKTAQFGYTLPQTLSKKFFVQKVRVYLAAQNLLTFTKYTGLDPELGVFNYGTNGRSESSQLDLGVDRGGTYPQARTYQIGVNATF